MREPWGRATRCHSQAKRAEAAEHLTLIVVPVPVLWYVVVYVCSSMSLSHIEEKPARVADFVRWRAKVVAGRASSVQRSVIISSHHSLGCTMVGRGSLGGGRGKEVHSRRRKICSRPTKIGAWLQVPKADQRHVDAPLQMLLHDLHNLVCCLYPVLCSPSFRRRRTLVLWRVRACSKKRPRGEGFLAAPPHLRPKSWPIQSSPASQDLDRYVWLVTWHRGLLCTYDHSSWWLSCDTLTSSPPS